jgi:cytochrome c
MSNAGPRSLPGFRRDDTMRFAIFALLVVATAPPAIAADPMRGAELYESRCIACHSIDANRVGPAHRGVFGRAAGMAKDYEYSPALEKANVIWDERMLDRWLTDPEKMIPGQRMNYSMPEAMDRADVIAYLRTQR